MAVKKASVDKYKLLEMKIRYERSYMDRLFEDSPEAIVISDTKGHIIRVNNEFTRLFGFEYDESIGKKLDHLVSSPKLKTNALHITKKTVTGDKVTLETERLRKDGSTVQVSIITSPIIINDKVEATYGIYRDITDRKKAEEALRESEERFNQVADNANEWIWEVDSHGLYTYSSPLVEKILGYKSEDIVGKKHFYDLFHPEDRELLKKSASKAFEKKESFHDFTNRNIDKNGKIVWLSTSGVPIIDKKGALIGYRGSDTDITERRRVEETLRESEEKFKTIFESAPDGYYLIDLKATLLDGNKKAEQLTGYKKEELIGKNLLKLKLLSAHDVSKAAKLLAKNIIGKPSGPDEFTLIRKDGSRITVEIHTHPIKLQNKALILGSVRDISDRKQMQEALLKEKSYLKQLFESAQEAIVMTDNDGRVMIANKEFKRMFGYKIKEAIGQFIDDLVAPSDLVKEASKATNNVARGKNVAFETMRRRKDGSLIHVSILGTPIIINENQIAVYAVYRDITERKKIEEAFLEEKSYLEQLFESAQEAIVMTDNIGKIKRVNRDFTRMFGYKSREAIGHKIDDLVAPPEFMKEATNITKVLANGKKMSLETIRRRKDGSSIHVSVHGSPIIINGEQVASYAIYRDITERKQAEEQILQAKEAALSASQAKSEFLANMSHEIRTPMNGIIGMTELTLDTQIDSIQRDYLESIQTSADSLLGIINDVLDFSRIEAKKIELENIRFKLRDFVNDAVTSISILAEKKGIETICDISPDTPDYVKGDPGRIRQILINLINNAIKFTEKGEIVVSVKVVSRSADKVYLHFSISDTGIGIPHEKQKLIFQSFTQVDGSTTRKYGGSGLGLSISASLVDLMNGKIWVESQVKKGSVFHFKIGLDIVEKIPGLPIRVDMEKLVDLPVLIVDDNETNRRILKEILLNWKMKPELASSGKQALRILRKSHKIEKMFSLILVDVQMPEMDGFSLVEHINKETKKYSPTIMMLTSLGIRGDASRCQELGISVYLVKPVKQSELLDAIMLLLGNEERQEKSTEVITRHTIRERRQSLRILLAEDNLINQKVMAKFLEKMGYQVSIAQNGAEAVSKVKKENFDLVLMDVQMPEMDGFEATAAIRKIEKTSRKHIPIIALTAHVLKGDREKCLNAGMDDYLAKPITSNKLSEKISGFMSKKQSKAGRRKL